MYLSIIEISSTDYRGSVICKLRIKQADGIVIKSKFEDLRTRGADGISSSPKF